MEDQQKEKKVLPGVKLLYDSDKKLSYTNESKKINTGINKGVNNIISNDFRSLTIPLNSLLTVILIPLLMFNTSY